MAITLDELLGRNTQTAQPGVERFPSYEEFQSTRGSAQSRMNNGSDYRYNYDVAPAQAVRSAESVRDYEANRPYVAPQSSEYQTRDYAFYENIRQRRENQQYQQPISQMPMQQPVQQMPMDMMQAPVMPGQPQQMPTYDYNQYAGTRQTPQSLYEFTAQDCDRLSEAELYNKLAHTEQEDQNVYARSEQKEETARKAHSRLNTKGKVIVGLYLAVIALVVTLIAVNASKINSGDAVTPSSNIQDQSAVQMHNMESSQIDSNYEVRI